MKSFSLFAFLLPLLLLGACSESSEDKKAYGAICQSNDQCQSNICATFGPIQTCTQQCTAAPCPNQDLCITAAGNQICKPSSSVTPDSSVNPFDGGTGDSGTPGPKAGFGALCSSQKACPQGLDCLTDTNATTGYCSYSCTNSGEQCPGAPTGTDAYCIIPVDKTDYCGFICLVGGKSTPCPTGMTCAKEDNPPNSGQRICEVPSSCTPQCSNKVCGPDGCGNSCQPGCSSTETCNASGQCVACTKCGGVCTDLQNDDNNCGTCGKVCNKSTCVAGECTYVTTNMIGGRAQIKTCDSTCTCFANCKVKPPASASSVPTLVAEAGTAAVLAVYNSSTVYTESSAAMCSFSPVYTKSGKNLSRISCCCKAP